MKRVFVVGATGQQGGAVIDSLVGKGLELFGLTRNIGSEKSKELFSKGVKMLEGNADDVYALSELLKGIDTLFFITTFFEKGTEYEIEQGLNVVLAAQKAQVDHVIYSSVAGANLNTGIPHFDSKYKVEESLAKSGLNYTIIAPVYFMDNLLAPWVVPTISEKSVYISPLPSQRKLQQISVKNIGEFGALMILKGQEVYGKRYDIAGDDLSSQELLEILSQEIGKTVTYVLSDLEDMLKNQQEMGIMYKWFIDVGYSSDIKVLQKDFPEVAWESFKDYINRIDHSVFS